MIAQLLNFVFKLYVKFSNQLNFLKKSVFSLFSPVLANFLIASSITRTGIYTITVSGAAERAKDGRKLRPDRVLSFPKVTPSPLTALYSPLPTSSYGKSVSNLTIYSFSLGSTCSPPSSAARAALALIFLFLRTISPTFL